MISIKKYILLACKYLYNMVLQMWTRQCSINSHGAIFTARSILSVSISLCPQVQQLAPSHLKEYPLAAITLQTSVLLL